MSLHTLGEFQEAGDRLARLGQEFPDGKEALYYLGLCRLETKQWSESRAAFRRYCDLAPENAESRRFLGDTYLQERQYDLAVEWYRKCVDIDPGDVEAGEKLRQARARLGPHQPGSEGSRPSRAVAGDSPAPTPPPSPSPSNPDASPSVEPNPAPVPPVAANPAPLVPAAAKTLVPPAVVSSENWLATGVVGSVGASYRFWVSLGGILVMVIVWIWILGACSARYKLPFTNDELAATNLSCLFGALALYVVWWGYASGWGWLGFYLGTRFLAHRNLEFSRQYRR